MNVRGFHPVLLGLLYLVMVTSCATAGDPGGVESETELATPISETRSPPGPDSDFTFTPRPEGGIDFDTLLLDPVVVQAFSEHRLDPSNLPQDARATRMVFLSLGRATHLAMQETDPPHERLPELQRISELATYMYVRGMCIHHKQGFPDELDQPEREDLNEIYARFFPHMVGVEFPACDGESLIEEGGR